MQNVDEISSTDRADKEIFSFRILYVDQNREDQDRLGVEWEKRMKFAHSITITIWSVNAFVRVSPSCWHVVIVGAGAEYK